MANGVIRHSVLRSTVSSNCKGEHRGDIFQSAITTDEISDRYLAVLVARTELISGRFGGIIGDLASNIVP